MVRPFQFSKAPKIYFSNGAISGLPDIIKQYRKEVVLITGNKSFISSGTGLRFLHDLEKVAIKYNIFSICGEPSPDNIDDAVNKLKNEDIGIVVGIGGGSVLDAGKAVSAMIYKTESVSDFLEGVGTKEHPGTKIPYIAVPTTSGTGSEATKNAVISKIGTDGFKRSLRHENFVPDIAIVDPELTLSCPKEITAACGMDCFTQLTEAYLSDKSSEYTDALAIEGLKEIKSSLLESTIDGDNIEARAGMSFAALTSGLCLANAGLGVVHGFASSIGGMYNIPHGLVCGTLMAVSNEINVKRLRERHSNPRALKKYAILGELFLEMKGRSDEYYADSFINYLHQLTIKLDLDRLGKFGLERKDIKSVCLKTEIKNNPVKLAVGDLEEILSSRL